MNNLSENPQETNAPYQTPETPPTETAAPADPEIVKELVNTCSSLSVINRLRLRGLSEPEARARVDASIPDAKKILAKRNRFFLMMAGVGIAAALGYALILVFANSGFTSVFRSLLIVFPIIIVIIARMNVKKLQF